MVSSTIQTSVEELTETLARFRRELADDPEYQELRARFPANWPM